MPHALKSRDISNTIADYLKPAESLLADLQVLQEECDQESGISHTDREAIRDAVIHVQSTIQCLRGASQ